MVNPLCFAAAYSRAWKRSSFFPVGGGGSFLCNTSLPTRLQLRSERRARVRLASMAASDPSPQKKSGEEMDTPFDLPNAPNDSTRNDGRATSGLFGIRIQTNGDVIKFGFVAVAIAYAFKFGLTSFGVRDILAGQITTGVVSVASLLAWVSTYVFRVGTKGMTYAQQLRDYENEVLKKRYEELTAEELAALGDELEEDD